MTDKNQVKIKLNYNFFQRSTHCERIDKGKEQWWAMIDVLPLFTGVLMQCWIWKKHTMSSDLICCEWIVLYVLPWWINLKCIVIINNGILMVAISRYEFKAQLTYNYRHKIRRIKYSIVYKRITNVSYKRSIETFKHSMISEHIFADCITFFLCITYESII